MSRIGAIDASVTDNPYSAGAWAAIAGLIAPLELWLLIKKDHSLSEQMRYWIQNSPLGSVLLFFWIWVAGHFILEPIVRKVSVMLKT